MGKLTFVFNQEKLEKEHKSENDLLYPMRQFAKEYGIEPARSTTFVHYLNPVIATQV